MRKNCRIPVLIVLFLPLLVWSLSCSGAVEGEAPSEGAVEATSVEEGEAGPLTDFTPVPTLAPTPMPAIPERRLMVLEWPPTIRTGDSDWVRLSLEMDEQGQLTPVAETPGNAVQGQPVEIPNVYESHRVYAAAQLSVAGLQVEPSGTRRERLLQGQKLELVWSVRPEEVGRYRGTIQVSLEFEPAAPGAQPLEPISLPAQTFEINGINLLGLGGTPARLVGLVGTFAGSLIGFDNLVPWFWKRFRRKGATKKS